jgi:hypothetical protein
MSKSDLSSCERQSLTRAAREADGFSGVLCSPLVMSFSENEKVMQFK